MAQRPEAAILLHLRRTLPLIFTDGGRGGGAAPSPSLQLEVGAHGLAVAGGDSGFCPNAAGAVGGARGGISCIE